MMKSKTKKIVTIIGVVVVAIALAFALFYKKKPTDPGTNIPVSNIPQKVLDNQDAFLEGEIWDYEGVQYQIVNGQWTIVSA